MKSVKMLLAATAFVATATAANAVQIDFGDFVTQTGLRDSLSQTYSGGGYTVTATATQTTDGVTSAAIVRASGSCGTASCGLPGPNEGGLGVVSDNDSNQSVETAGAAEMLYLTFNTAVRITGISFSRVFNDQFGPDTAMFLVDGKVAGQRDVDAYGWPSFLPTDFIGTVLGIGAVGANDEFKVRAVEISPVPVPPALVLLASGLAGMGALARRRNKK